MKRILILVMILLSNQANAQWKQIADFNDEYITCVYFLDLQGPPRIGFVGTGTTLNKTTDGGSSWTEVWSKGNYALYYVTDICFKDSLTGWFSIAGDSDACYRTTDGGNHWNEIYGSPYGALGVDFNAQYNRLFLSLNNFRPTSTLVSSDLGNTWGSITISQPITDSQTTGITFLSDSIGLASWSAFYPDTTCGFLRTMDGGLAWTLELTPFACEQALGIPGTPICFATSIQGIKVWRSDDYGETWKKIADFGPLLDSQGIQISPYGTGYIKGDLSRLYIQTDSGMYVSFDSGVTWKNDGGPSYITNFSNDEFYSAKGVTIAGMTYSDGGIDVDDGLWEEDTGVISGVAESATANSNNALSVFPNPATSSITVESANGPVSILDPLGRSYTTPQPPPPIESRAGPWKGGGVSIDISMLPSGVYFISVGYSRAKFVKQ
jgi:photosystem II stability/assembly factor-like uncharacterized protein